MNVVITDRRAVAAPGLGASTWEAVVVSTADYYPFVMLKPSGLKEGALRNGTSTDSNPSVSMIADISMFRANSTFGCQVNNLKIGKLKTYVSYANNQYLGFLQTDGYRYAYNGMERDNEVSGNGNSYTTEFRQYDPRLGRWKSLDPLMHQFPWMSPYVAFDNNPVFYTDIFGLSSGGPDEPNDYERPPEQKTTEGGKLVNWEYGDKWIGEDGSQGYLLFTYQREINEDGDIQGVWKARPVNVVGVAKVSNKEYPPIQDGLSIFVGAQTDNDVAGIEQGIIDAAISFGTEYIYNSSSGEYANEMAAAIYEVSPGIFALGKTVEGKNNDPRNSTNNAVASVDFTKSKLEGYDDSYIVGWVHTHGNKMGSGSEEISDGVYVKGASLMSAQCDKNVARHSQKLVFMVHASGIIKVFNPNATLRIDGVDYETEEDVEIYGVCIPHF